MSRTLHRKRASRAFTRRTERRARTLAKLAWLLSAVEVCS